MFFLKKTEIRFTERFSLGYPYFAGNSCIFQKIPRCPKMVLNGFAANSFFSKMLFKKNPVFSFPASNSICRKIDVSRKNILFPRKTCIFRVLVKDIFWLTTRVGNFFDICISICFYLNRYQLSRYENLIFVTKFILTQFMTSLSNQKCINYSIYIIIIERNLINQIKLLIKLTCAH